MQIKDLARLTRVPEKTIRFYEKVALLPKPQRRQNGYRHYAESDVERLRLVAGLRHLDFSLEEIKEILDLRDRKIAPCATLLSLLQEKANEISQRIAELQQLEKDIRRLHSAGQRFPTDDVEGKNCVCHLVSNHTTL
jgi:DNA-binding transcriptional MerR regulator